MFRFTIRDVLWLMVVVGLSAIVGGSFNAAVADDPAASFLLMTAEPPLGKTQGL